MKKEDLFDISVQDKYIETSFKYEAPTIRLRVDLSFNLTQSHLTQEDADKYVEGVMYCIKKFEELNKKNNLTHDPLLMVATVLNKIESWTCPIMSISRFTIEDLSDKLYEFYVNEYNKKKDRIEILISRKKENADSLNAKEEDELFTLNDALNYGLDKEFIRSRAEKHLDRMLELTGEMLDILKKRNNEKDSN